MAVSHADDTLDAILALQALVAWAGEARSEPRRLGWWETDLVDEAGGGDFLARLLPRTHAWAAIEGVREAARRVDAKARAQLARGDALRSIFFLGFELDEQLGDRLAWHKRSGLAPAEALPLAMPLSAKFSKPDFVATIGGDAAFTVVPGGRKLTGKAPPTPDAMVKKLVAALAPIADHYPLPYYEPGA